MLVMAVHQTPSVFDRHGTLFRMAVRSLVGHILAASQVRKPTARWSGAVGGALDDKLCSPLQLLRRAFTHRNFRRLEECRTLIQWLDPRPRERILDVGCGDGFYSRRIADRGADVVGIELNRQRFAVANRRHRPPRNRFLLMDAEEMGFGDETFDKVVSFCVIEHFRRDERVLKHAARVLRPGGTLLLSADSLSNPEIRPDERTEHRRRYAVNTFYTVSDLKRKLLGAGLEPQGWRYILTAPLTLGLVRASWRMDDWPSSLAPVKFLGHAALSTGGKLLSDLAEVVSGRRNSGLTLLARARKPSPGDPPTPAIQEQMTLG